MALARELGAPVTFLGHLARPALREEFGAYAGVVVPSTWPENCPLMVLEAMAAGRPLVASRVGGLPDSRETVRRACSSRRATSKSFAPRCWLWQGTRPGPLSSGAPAGLGLSRSSRQTPTSPAYWTCIVAWERDPGGGSGVRIAMIGQKTSVADVGGVEGHVAHLAAGLAERGHEVTVFTRSRYGAPPPGDVDIRQRWCLPLKHFEAISHSAVCSFEALASGFDIVHYHGVGPALIVPVSALRPRTTVCVTVHNRTTTSASGRPSLASGCGPEKTACARADQVIVVARYLERHMLAAHDRESRYIPNGHEPVARLPATNVLAAHRLEPRRYLLFLARLVPEKGADVLIEAVRRATASPYRVAIVGGDSHSTTYAASLHHLAAGDSRFVFLGHQSGDALAEIRANAGHYVMPSFQEGLPLSLLEALSAGLSVIASDIPAVSEINGTVSPERITLVPPGDAVALAEAIDNLPYPAEPPSDEGMAWPSWDEVAEEVERVYMGGRRAGVTQTDSQGKDAAAEDPAPSPATPAA